MPDSRRPDWLKTVVFSLTPLAALLAIGEVGARFYEAGHSELPADPTMGFTDASCLFVPLEGRPGMLAVNPEKRANFVEQVIAQPKPAGLFRVVVVGESSVFFLQPELMQLQQWLDARLKPLGRRAEVIDAGGKSYGSERLKILSRELVRYQPDLAILYFGNNEFEEITQMDLFSASTSGLQSLLSRLALFRVARDQLARIRIDRLVRANPHDGFVEAWEHPFKKEEIPARMSAFRHNLAEIVRDFRAAGAQVLLGTIPSNIRYPWKSQYDTPEQKRAQLESYRPAFQLYEAGRFKEGYELMNQILKDLPRRHQSTVYENAIIREVARAEGVPLFDMVRVVEAAEPHGVPGETLFADNCHFNDQGRALWLREVERALVDDRLLPMAGGGKR